MDSCRWCPHHIHLAASPRSPWASQDPAECPLAVGQQVRVCLFLFVRLCHVCMCMCVCVCVRACMYVCYQSCPACDVYVCACMCVSAQTRALLCAHAFVLYLCAILQMLNPGLDKIKVRNTLSPEVLISFLAYHMH